MSSPDSKTHARAELFDLIESQLDTLEKEKLGSITKAELREYEGRCDRIHQLCAELNNREAAA